MESYPFAEMQSMYSTTPPDDWADKKLNWTDVVFLCVGNNYIIHIYQPLRLGRIWHKVNF